MLAKLSFIDLCQEDYPSARAWLEMLFNELPDGHYLYPLAHLYTAQLLEAEGNASDALKQLDLIEGPLATRPSTIAFRALCCGAMDDRHTAQMLYDDLRNLRSRAALRPFGYVPASSMALAALAVRDDQSAVNWLWHAMVERDPVVLTVNIIPCFRTLRNNEQLREIMGPGLGLALF